MAAFSGYYARNYTKRNKKKKKRARQLCVIYPNVNEIEENRRRLKIKLKFFRNLIFLIDSGTSSTVAIQNTV